MRRWFSGYLPSALLLSSIGGLAIAAPIQEVGPPPPPRGLTAGDRGDVLGLRRDDAQRELERLIASKLKSSFDTSGYGLTSDEKKVLRQLENAISSNDDKRSHSALAKARAAAQGPGAKFVLGALQLQLGGKLKDAAMQSEATDLVVGSGAAPQRVLPTLYRNQGMYALEANNLGKAEEAFGKAAELASDDAETAVILAQVKNDLGKHHEALTLFDRAIALKTAANQQIPPVWIRAADSTRRIVLRKGAK